MPSESDRLLVQQIRQGQSCAWDNLIARYEGRLLAFVERRLRDCATSEDVVQETFIGFLNSLPNYDEERELQTYLFTIASHKLTDHLRRAAGTLCTRCPTARAISWGNSTTANRPPQAWRSQERRELESEAVARCLGEMIREWHGRGELLRLKVIELLLVKGWANRDVAAWLKISEQQVANFRFAAVRKLAEHIRACRPTRRCLPGAAIRVNDLHHR